MVHILSPSLAKLIFLNNNKNNSIMNQRFRVLRWFGHVERMDEYRRARRVSMVEVSGAQVPGRPRLLLL